MWDKKISVVIITYNEENKIRHCLESIQWADEIIVIDSFSEDNTIAVAKDYTDKIYKRSWQGYGEQKNFGITLACNKWILFLDADERVSEGLAKEIQEVVRFGSDLFEGYYMPRHSFYLEKMITHGEWYPDFKLRLIKNGSGMWSRARVHEELIIEGEIGYFKEPIYHNSYNGILHHIRKINRYSSLYAQDLFDCGVSLKLSQFLWKPLVRFAEGYFYDKGFLDGFTGFYIAFMHAFEVFLRYVKYSILRIKGKAGSVHAYSYVDIQSYRRRIRNENK
jgi:glycosyltransferase involved in cell wall biosynthesis